MSSPVRSLLCFMVLESQRGVWLRRALPLAGNRGVVRRRRLATAAHEMAPLPFAVEYHAPVMPSEVCAAMITDVDGVYVDGTLGGGGHSTALLSQLASGKGKVLAVDRDPQALASARARLADPLAAGRFWTAQSDFRDLGRLLCDSKGPFGQALPADGLGVHGLLLDLGVSSHQLDAGERGFSHARNGPLDMRMEGEDGGTLTASTILNEWDEEHLEQVLRVYGEEPLSRKIGRRIVSSRPLNSTADLVDVVQGSLPPGPVATKKKCLSRVFQALRIVVNDEMGALEAVLADAARVVRPGGRLVILSYHSLEHRPVRNVMRSGTLDGGVRQDFYGNKLTPWTLLRKVPKEPSPGEVELNPRSRSAQLRAAERTELPVGDRLSSRSPAPPRSGRRKPAARQAERRRRR